MDEAEVEHSIRLVEDQNFDARQTKRFSVDKVEQAPGRRHHDVDTRREPPLLGANRDAAEHDRSGERQLAPIGAEALRDLAGQLSRRAEHERSAGAGCSPCRCAEEAMENRQCESGCLAGPGLGDAAKIAAMEHLWDGL